MKKETYSKELKKCDSGTECFIVAKAYIKSLEKQLEAVKNKIEIYKEQIEDLKSNDSFKEAEKVQTVSVLREICQDLEMIMGIK